MAHVHVLHWVRKTRANEVRSEIIKISFDAVQEEPEAKPETFNLTFNREQWARLAEEQHNYVGK
jgi:hypothetical protein